MSFSRQRGLYTLLVVALLSAITVWATNSLYQNYASQKEQERQEHLQQNLQKAVIEFNKGVDKFAILVLGIRSHILETGRMLEPLEMQRYIRNYLADSEYTHSFIINYFSPDHVFLFSISETNLIVNDLVGKNILAIRDTSVTNRMDKVIQGEGLLAQPPINLLEGFVGLPVDFRVKFGNEVIGYLTPMTDIRNILKPILANDLKQEFTYYFSSTYHQEYHFDQEVVSNGTKVHHSRSDSTNSQLDKEHYLTTQIEKYGLSFDIGIAYRPGLRQPGIQSFISATYSIILSLILISASLIYFFGQSLNRRAELQGTNRELKHMNGLLRKFIYASSHDLKQPVVNIDNFQRLLKQRLGNHVGVNEEKFFQIIGQNIGRMKAILDDLLIYSRAIQREQKKEPVPLTKVLEELGAPGEAEGFRLIYENLPIIQGNYSQVYRLFENLISNATKFNDNEVATIEINAQRIGQKLILLVRDDGIGIVTEDLGVVFEEFKRLHRDRYPGTGLGLAICAEIVKNLGGQIRAEQNSNGGTDIIIELYEQD